MSVSSLLIHFSCKQFFSNWIKLVLSEHAMEEMVTCKSNKKFVFFKYELRYEETLMSPYFMQRHYDCMFISHTWTASKSL